MAPEERADEQGELVLAVEATALDIGLAGLAVETDTRLPPQRAVALRILEERREERREEREPEGGRGEIAVRGRVVWCFFHGTSEGAAGETLPVYRAGIEFTDVLTPVAESLVRFLESHALVDGGETRLFGRFRLGESNRVRIESSTPFRLLGLAGGEAEVEARLAIEVAPGTRARLALLGGGRPLEAHVTDLVRGEAGRDRWRLRLALDSPAEAAERLRPLLGAG